MEQAVSQPQKSMSPGKRILLIGGLIFLIGWVAVVAVNMGSIESTQMGGRKAPEFTVPLFDQFEQDELALADLRGQVVVVNFWASWCVECYKEAELLEQAWQDYKDQGVMFVGVDYLDTEKEALKYMVKYGITYPSGPDIGSKISKAYGLTGVPETFFIDKDGNIAHVQIGPIEHEQLYALLDELVARPPEGT
jgi:cytochrome c biogenesis protein CcmG/thiol:disulfide interchange protein DsbE